MTRSGIAVDILRKRWRIALNVIQPAMSSVQSSRGTRYAGAVDPEGVGYIPNITPTRIRRLVHGSDRLDVATGDTPNHGRVGSSMSDVVTNMAMLPAERSEKRSPLM